MALTPLPTRVLSPTDLGVPPPDGILFMAAPGIPRLLDPASGDAVGENHGWNRKNQLEYLGMMISGGNVGICWNMLEYVRPIWIWGKKRGSYPPKMLELCG